MKLTSRTPLLLGASLVIAATLGYPDAAHADPVSNTVPSCTSAPAAKGKSPQRSDAVSLMLVANELEAQGEADFHLHYTKPADECLVESFSVGDVEVQARYARLEKDVSALLYRFIVERPGGTSEVLVLYSGTASMALGRGYVFHVSEEKGGIISWYALFKEEPTYTGVRTLVEQMIAGSAKALMVVRWPPGAKEGEIMEFDSKRLK